MFYLVPVYDKRKSFYNKASVEEKNGKISLFSYNTKVAEIVGNTLSVLDARSMTTRRHIMEFAKQNGFGNIECKESLTIKK